jgi:hypothetical protein
MREAMPERQGPIIDRGVKFVHRHVPLEPKCIVCGKPERDRLHQDFDKIAAAEESHWG